MVGSEGLFLDRKGAFVERFCVFVAAQGIEKICQMVEALGDIGMVRAEGLLPDRKGAFVERFCVFVAALVIVQPSQKASRPTLVSAPYAASKIISFE